MEGGAFQHFITRLPLYLLMNTSIFDCPLGDKASDHPPDIVATKKNKKVQRTGVTVAVVWHCRCWSSTQKDKKKKSLEEPDQSGGKKITLLIAKRNPDSFQAGLSLLLKMEASWLWRRGEHGIKMEKESFPHNPLKFKATVGPMLEANSPRFHFPSLPLPFYSLQAKSGPTRKIQTWKQIKPPGKRHRSYCPGPGSCQPIELFTSTDFWRELESSNSGETPHDLQRRGCGQGVGRNRWKLYLNWLLEGRTGRGCFYFKSTAKIWVFHFFNQFKSMKKKNVAPLSLLRCFTFVWHSCAFHVCYLARSE